MKKSLTELQQRILPQSSSETESQITISNVNLDSAKNKVEHSDSEVKLPSRTDSIANYNLYLNKNIEAKEHDMKALRSEKIFPVFNNTVLAKISPNYFWYFEFYHMAIRLLFATLLLAIVAFVIFFIVIAYTPDADLSKIKARMFFASIMIFGVFITAFKSMEMNRLLKSPVLYEHQWTEDLFSLIVKRLPPDTTKQGIIDYFNMILDGQGVSGRVKDVVMLQDYRSYAQLKKRLAAINTKIDVQNRKEHRKKEIIEVLTKEKASIEGQLHRTTKDLIEFACFKGRAIVIFECIEAKETIRKYFKIHIFKRFAIYFCRDRYTNYYLGDSRIKIRIAPEPENLIFENLHFSRLEKRRRILLAYLLSSLFSVLVSGLLIYYESQKYGVDIPHEDFAYKGDQSSIKFAIVIIIVKAVSEKIYNALMSFIIYPSKLDYELNRTTFSIYLSFLLYVVFQVASTYFLEINLTVQLIKVVLISFLTRSVKMILIAIAASISKKRLGSVQPYSLKARVMMKVVSKFENFNLIQGVSAGIRMMFIGVAFLSQDPLVLLPLLIIVLYMCAIADKYKMVRCCNLIEIKSARYMLASFKAFQFVTIFSLWCTTYVFRRYILTKEVNIAVLRIDMFQYIYFVFVYGSLLYWPSSLQTRVNELFNRKSALTPYDFVCKNFPSVYRRLDPWREIKLAELK